MVDKESILIDDKFLQVIRSDSGKVRIFINTPKFTLVPSEFYSADLREKYVRCAHGMNKEELIIENQFNEGKYYLLFPINQKLKHSFDINFRESEIYHYATVLASRLLDEDKTNGTCILLNKQENQLYLVISKNRSIIFLNSYLIKQDDDLIYFTLNSLRDNDIDPRSARVFYSGNITANDRMIPILKKYIKSLIKLTQSSNKKDINSFYKYFRFNQTTE